MTQEFKDFLSQNMAELDEVGLSKLQAGIQAHDDELAGLQSQIAELQSKNDALSQQNIGLNKTNIDLVLRLSGQGPSEGSANTGSTEDNIMSTKDLINNFDKMVI